MLLDWFHRAVVAQIITLRLASSGKAHQAFVQVLWGLDAAGIDPDRDVFRGRIKEILNGIYFGIVQLLDQVLFLGRIGNFFYVGLLLRHCSYCYVVVIRLMLWCCGVEKPVLRCRGEKVLDDFERSPGRRRFRMLRRIVGGVLRRLSRRLGQMLQNIFAAIDNFMYYLLMIIGWLVGSRVSLKCTFCKLLRWNIFMVS